MDRKKAPMAWLKMMRTRYLTDDDKRSLERRLNRAAGQVAGVRRMVEEAECVDKVLLQISAAKSALTEVALELMERHLVNCTETCMEGEREAIIRRVTRAVSAVIRNG